MTAAYAGSPQRKSRVAARARQRGVVIVMPVFMPEMSSGAERQCSILAPQLVRLGWRVTVLTPTSMAALPHNEMREGGVEVRRIYTPHLPFLGGRYLASALSWTLRAFWHLVREAHAYDAIYVFHARLHSAPAVLAAAALGKPLAIKIGRGGETFDFRSLSSKKFFYGSWLLALVRTTTRAFVANSGEIADDLQAADIPASRIIKLPNGVEAAKDRSDSRRARNLFLYAGRLSEEKRIDALLEGFAEARQQAPEIELLIAGDGPERAALMQVARQLGVSESVRFLGHVERVSDLYAQAAFFISASDSEGQSNAMLEAMAHGALPIVCGASGVADAVAHGETGFVFERPTPALLTGAIVSAARLSEAERAAMAARGRARVDSFFEIGRVASATSELLNSLIARDAHRS